jgi:hypothetical protein
MVRVACGQLPPEFLNPIGFSEAYVWLRQGAGSNHPRIIAPRVIPGCVSSIL